MCKSRVLFYVLNLVKLFICINWNLSISGDVFDSLNIEKDRFPKLDQPIENTHVDSCKNCQPTTLVFAFVSQLFV